MQITSTEFRKNLFQILDRTLHGESVEVTHKGRLVRLVPADKPGKLSHVDQGDTVNGTPEELARAQDQLDSESDAWDEKWARNP